MNGLSGEEAIANFTGRRCMAALYSMRLLRCAAHTIRLAPRNDRFFYSYSSKKLIFG